MSSRLHYFPFVLFVTLAAVANLAGPSLFWDMNFRMDSNQILAAMATGALVAEVALLGIWSAVGPSTVIFRLPVTVGVLVLLTCAYVVGLQIPESAMPVEVAIVVIVGAALGFLAVQVPLWIMRAVSMQRIALLGSTALSPQEERSQFGLKHLIGWTTAISILLVIVKSSIPSAAAQNTNTDWLQLIGILTVFALFSASVTLPCLFLTLSKKRVWLWLIPLVGTTCGGPFVVLFALISMFGPGPDFWQLVTILFSFGIGACLTTCLVLGCCRLMGYRLERPDGNRKTGALETVLK